MILAEFHKAQADTLDYVVSYASWLADLSDTIASVSWHVPPGLTAASASNTTTTATNWLSGGTPGTKYVVSVTATTAASPARIKKASFIVRIEGNV